MGSLEVSTRIDAPPSTVWRLLADYGGIARWNPLLSASRLLDTPNGGVGAVRHCDIRGGGYTRERVVAWQEGASCAWDVFETDRPLERATNRISLRPEGAGTVATFHLDFALKGGAFGKLMEVLMANRKMREAASETLHGLKVHAEASPQEAPVQAPGIAP